MKIHHLLALAAAVFVAGCQTPKPAPRTVQAPTIKYIQGPTRTHTNTVYVRETDEHPTSLPGEARPVADPGEPSRFEPVSR
jgi:uncharacterized lipoprotein YajG